MARASQTRNTLLLVRKLDSLPSTDNQVAVVSSGSSLTLTSARRHAPVKNDRAGRSILPPGQVNAWLLDHGIFGPLAIVVQNLAMKPEIAISRYPAWAQQEWDEVLEGAAQMEGSTKTPVKNDYASTRAMELCQ
ncbi:hypothetical protein PENSUB_7889 [Penicillium subrubescens]|uniref:Uncharacterized protein n=1 Tax=Penicillium subrubescens TaxID=1316194 RepID=A0A1Q5TJN1_9EURO|nr:hypothetical protein PENSUB_7889 [Penicillium subrubescens]